MTQPGIVTVPLQAHPAWSPAWDDLRLGEVEPRGIDATQWAASANLMVASIAIAVDPVLDVAETPLVVGATATILLAAGGMPGDEPKVAFTLSFLGREDGFRPPKRVITVRQPIRAALAQGLIPIVNVAPPDGALFDAGGILVDGAGAITGPYAAVVGPLLDAGGALSDADGPLLAA